MYLCKRKQTTRAAADRINNGTKVMKSDMTIQEWFDRKVARYESKGMSRIEAVEEAFVDLACATRFCEEEKAAFCDSHEEYEGFKTRDAEACRTSYLQTARIKYHEVGKPFNVNMKNGTFRMVAVEKNGCSGCIFSYTKGYAQAGYPVYGCWIETRGGHAVCKASYTSPLGVELSMREDGKNVIYKYVKQ